MRIFTHTTWIITTSLWSKGRRGEGRGEGQLTLLPNINARSSPLVKPRSTENKNGIINHSIIDILVLPTFLFSMCEKTRCFRHDYWLKWLGGGTIGQYAQYYGQILTFGYILAHSQVNWYHHHFSQHQSCLNFIFLILMMSTEKYYHNCLSGMEWNRIKWRGRGGEGKGSNQSFCQIFMVDN